MIRNHATFLAPDWVILGLRTELPDPGMGYMVMASDTLTAAEISASVEQIMYADDRALLRAFPGETMYMLSTSMHSIVIVYGEDYAECLHRLLKDWTPNTPSATTMLGRPARELGGGRDGHGGDPVPRRGV